LAFNGAVKSAERRESGGWLDGSRAGAGPVWAPDGFPRAARSGLIPRVFA